MCWLCVFEAMSEIPSEFLNDSFDLDDWVASAVTGSDESGLERLRDSLAVSENSLTQQVTDLSALCPLLL